MKRDAQSCEVVRLSRWSHQVQASSGGKRSQEHEEAHSGQLPLEKAKSWDQSQQPMLSRLSAGFQHIPADQTTTDHIHPCITVCVYVAITPSLLEVVKHQFLPDNVCD